MKQCRIQELKNKSAAMFIDWRILKRPDQPGIDLGLGFRRIADWVNPAKLNAYALQLSRFTQISFHMWIYGFITKSSWSNIPKVLDRNCRLQIRSLRQAKDRLQKLLQMSLEDQLRTAAAQVHFCFLVDRKQEVEHAFVISWHTRYVEKLFF